MLRRSTVSLLVVAALCTLAQANPTVYSGQLTFQGGGITGIAGNPWLADGTSFSWSVIENGDGTYTYGYRLQVPECSKEISHMTIEVSPTFQANNIQHILLGTLADDQPDDYPKASDPGMPDEMRGLKFEEGAGGTDHDWTVAFVSDRAPVWGDFYAKDGKSGGTWVAIWNTGFGNPDSDPTSPAGNGSIYNHILVPDTHGCTVPAPGALILGGIGTSLISWLRRRRVF